MGNGGMNPYIHLGTKGKWVVSLMPWPLCSWGRTTVPFEQEARWIQQHFWMFWRREDCLTLKMNVIHSENCMEHVKDLRGQNAHF